MRYVLGHVVQSWRISQVVHQGEWRRFLVRICYHDNRRVSTVLYYLVIKQFLVEEWKNLYVWSVRRQKEVYSLMALPTKAPTEVC